MIFNGRDVAYLSSRYRRGTKLLAPYYLQDWLTLTRASQGTIYDAGSTLQTIGAGLPRWDWNPANGEFRGLLFEEQRVNLLLHSEDLTNAVWDEPDRATAQAAEAPSGEVTANKLSETDSNLAHRTRQNTSVESGQTYTISGFFKAGERGFALMATTGASTLATVQINLTTGAVTSGTGTPLNMQSTALPDNWFRVAFSFITNSTGPAGVLYYPSADGIWDNRNYQGIPGSGIYFWGAQMEKGTWASSYIPTTTAAATRNRDELGGTLPAALQTADGHWEIDADLGDVPRNAGQVLFRLRKFDDPFTTAERRVTWDPVNKRVTASITDGPASVVDQTISSANDSWTSGRKRVGLVTDNDSSRTRLLLDGAVVATLEHDQLITAPEDLYIGRNPGNANTDFVGHIRNMTHIPVTT